LVNTAWSRAARNWKLEAGSRELEAGSWKREAGSWKLEARIIAMPKTVAVIGASSNRHKYGNKALRAFEKQGYTVLAINPNETAVEGHRTYASVLDVPGTIDMATLYVQPEVGVKVMGDIARKGIKEIWLNPGADAPEVLAKARELGLTTIQACSIVGIGESPSLY
jgi:uncharacterized protein